MLGNVVVGGCSLRFKIVACIFPSGDAVFIALDSGKEEGRVVYLEKGLVLVLLFVLSQWKEGGRYGFHRKSEDSAPTLDQS